MKEIESTNEILVELGYSPVDLSAPDGRRTLARFVKGPIPLGWLARVNVSAYATLVAMLVKMVVDTRGTEPVTIPPVLYRQVGLSRNKCQRAFDALESAGIIRTRRLLGKPIQIWLIDKPQEQIMIFVEGVVDNNNGEV